MTTPRFAQPINLHQRPSPDERRQTGTSHPGTFESFGHPTGTVSRPQSALPRQQAGGLAFSGLHHLVGRSSPNSFVRPPSFSRAPDSRPLAWPATNTAALLGAPMVLRSLALASTQAPFGPASAAYLPSPPTGRQGVAGPAGSPRVAAPAASSPAATTGRTAPASPLISGAIARVTPAKMPSTMAGAAAPDIEREASATIRPTSSTIRPTSAAIRATSAQTAARRLAPSVPHPVTSTLRALAPLVSLRGARTTSSPPGTPVLSSFPAPALRHTAVLARLGTPAPAILGAGAAPIHNAATPTVLRAPSPAHRGPDTPPIGLEPGIPS